MAAYCKIIKLDVVNVIIVRLSGTAFSVLQEKRGVKTILLPISRCTFNLSSTMITQTKRANSRVSSPHGAGHSDSLKHLRRLADEFVQISRHFDPSNAELNERLLTIKKELDIHVSTQLTAPINNRADFSERFRQIKRAHKLGQFDDSLRIATSNLNVYLNSIEREETIEYWKCKTLVYELNDIFHLDDTIKERTFDLGEQIREELREVAADATKTMTDDERRLIREKVLFCSCRANELKRRGDTTGSRKLYEWLLDFTSTKVQTDRLRFFGTLATISYQLGSVLGTLEQYSDAESMYLQALTFLNERSKGRSDDLDDHFFVQRRQALIIGAGFGWINLTRGFLRRGENAVTTARSLLAKSDPTARAYVDLLYGTIKRCRAGSDPKQLRASALSLIDARRFFKRQHRGIKHKEIIPSRQEARVCWQLSLTLTAAGKIKAAEKYLEFAARYAKQSGDPKWQTNIYVQQSRISRHKGQLTQALTHAELAVGKADECEAVLPLIDAYMTRGEVHFYLAQASAQAIDGYGNARKDFEQALRLTMRQIGHDRRKAQPDNPKVASVCHLRLAHCYAREADEATAREHFAYWERLSSNVEHQWIWELSREVQNELDSLSASFTISASNDEEWNYTRSVIRMRKWLLAQALRKTKKNYSKAAMLLGVRRATLYEWERAGLQPKRARAGERRST